LKISSEKPAMGDPLHCRRSDGQAKKLLGLKSPSKHSKSE